MLSKMMLRVPQWSLLGERAVHSLPASFTKKNSWNRSVSDAEKLVGYPTSLMSVRALMEDDFANVAVHMRKLIGSEHPVLHTVKRLIYSGKNTMQLRGLVMLLVSRAAGQVNTQDVDPNTGVTEKQRKLAELIEMIHTGQAIHQSVVNLPVNIAEEPDEDIRSVLLELEFGNKISILGGDYLLANASTGLAGLRIPKIVEIVSQAISDFSQSEFLGCQDPQGRVIPSEESLEVDNWLVRARLGSSSLLAAGCHGAVMLGGHGEQVQAVARELGTNLAIAIRAHDEKILFTEEGGAGAGAVFSLASAPVMFHLQQDKELLAHIQTFSHDLSLLNYRKVFDKVLSGDAMERTSQLCEEYVDKSLEILKNFDESEATEAIEKIATSILH